MGGYFEAMKWLIVEHGGGDAADSGELMADNGGAFGRGWRTDTKSSLLLDF